MNRSPNRTVCIAFFVLMLVPAVSAGPFKEIVDTYMISVLTDTDAGDFFPDTWLGSPENGKAAKMRDSEIKRFPAILKKALSRYSVTTIRNNLRGIYLAGTISMYDTEYGATNSSDVVYLCSTGKKDGYTDAVIEAGFHHEFAHILKRNYDFPSADWAASNPKGFKYSGSGVESIQGGTDSEEGNAASFRKGFVSEYSQSSENEDYAAFSEWVFMQPKKLKGLIRQYPAMKKKWDVWIAFASTISKTFTEKSLLNS